MTETPSPRLSQLRKEVTARLQGVCSGWPPRIFADLVDSVAAITLKYEMAESRLPPSDPAAATRLLAQFTELARIRAEQSRSS
jgi:hypothetical protein